jgi:hypothetical protein
MFDFLKATPKVIGATAKRNTSDDPDRFRYRLLPAIA